MDFKTIAKLLNRPKDSNKYDFGHVLIIGGSPGMVGAPLLSAMAALRMGTGLVTIGSSIEVIDKLERRVLEVMTLRIPHDPKKAVITLVEFIKERRVSVVVFGPGMNQAFSPIMKETLEKIDIPTILDAGAVTNFAGDLENLTNNAHKNNNWVLTPHDGEFKKLTGKDLPRKMPERIKVAIEFTKKNGVTLICKGNPTLVSHSNGEIFENTTGNPGLATAGSGDVLDGVIAGLIAQKFEINQAVEIGVYLHGLAADLAVIEKTQAGLIASDVIDYLPKAILTASSPNPLS